MKILKLLSREGNSLKSYKEIGKKIGISRQAVEGHISDLVEDGLIVIDRIDGNTIEKSLTAAADKMLELTEGSRGVDATPDFSSDGTGAFRLHNFAMVFPIRNSGELSEEWQDAVVQRSERRWRWNSESSQYVTNVDGNTIILSRKTVEIRTKEEVGDPEDLHELRQRCISKVLKAKDWLEQGTSLQLGGKPVKVRCRLPDDISREEWAFIQGPLAQFVDDYTSLEPNDVEVRKKSGERIYWLDRSPGETEEETNQFDRIDDVLDMYRRVLEGDLDLDEMEEACEFMGGDPGRRLDVLESATRLLMVRELKEGNKGGRTSRTSSKTNGYLNGGVVKDTPPAVKATKNNGEPNNRYYDRETIEAKERLEDYAFQKGGL